MDPKIAEVVSKELSRNAVVVFDEAHNIGRLEAENKLAWFSMPVRAGTLNLIGIYLFKQIMYALTQ